MWGTAAPKPAKKDGVKIEIFIDGKKVHSGRHGGGNIMGYLAAGKGVVVHRINGRNVRGFRKHPDRCLDVAWAPITRSMFKVALRILTRNNPGVLANVSASISEAGSNIEKVERASADSGVQ